MITVIPWQEFVACPEIVGMHLQVRRPKRQKDLWGEIEEISYDGRELVVKFSRTFAGDPRESMKEADEKVESFRILPERQGPVYTEHIAFAARDLNTGYECYIRCLRVAPKRKL